MTPTLALMRTGTRRVLMKTSITKVVVYKLHITITKFTDINFGILKVAAFCSVKHDDAMGGQHQVRRSPYYTCHILPPSEIDRRLFRAVFARSEGRYPFHCLG